MSTKVVSHRFAVTGNGTFPVDMLRYDRCTPEKEGDSGIVLASGKRTVYITGPFPPTVARWESFGWSVQIL